MWAGGLVLAPQLWVTGHSQRTRTSSPTELGNAETPNTGDTAKSNEAHRNQTAPPSNHESPRRAEKTGELHEKLSGNKASPSQWENPFMS